MAKFGEVLGAFAVGALEAVSDKYIAFEYNGVLYYTDDMKKLLENSNMFNNAKRVRTMSAIGLNTTDLKKVKL